MSLETPIHRVEGLGAAHSGTQHFWRERITAVALVPLSIWFGFSAIWLIGADETIVLSYLHHPWNAGLMGLFVVITLMHQMIGIQSVIDDYVQQPGLKIVCLLLNRAFAWVVGLVCIIALLQIAL
ncbi:MAG: succinate dehydrogenase, hydrophobic membrane anchor protein [Rhizomicrobium sp.]|jgi:succinate dehydrogenase / fumarate reductase membrane anchor subunit